MGTLLLLCVLHLPLECSFADPECLSPIRIFPTRIQGQKDPEYGSASKNLSIFYPKKLFLALGNMIRDLHSGSRSWFFTHPGSRFQGQKGIVSRIRVRNTARMWINLVFFLILSLLLYPRCSGEFLLTENPLFIYFQGWKIHPGTDRGPRGQGGGGLNASTGKVNGR